MNKHSIAKRVVNISFNVIFAIVILISAYIMIAGIVANQKNESPVIFGRSYSVVATNSMDPTIKVGEIIVFKKVSYDEVLAMIDSSSADKPIIVFRNSYGMQVVHRAVGTSGNTITTKGDNPLASIDVEPVTENNFIGVVVDIMAGTGVANFLLNYRNIIFLIASLTLVYVLIKQIIKLAKEWMKREKERNSGPEVVENFDKDKFIEEELRKYKEELLNKKDDE